MKLSTIKRRFNKEFKWVTYPNPLIKAAPRIWSFILEYFEPKSNQVEAQVMQKIAEDIEKQMLEEQFSVIKIMSCMGDPDGKHLPTKILLQMGKETKWFIKVD